MDIPLPNAPAGSFMEGAKQANALSEQGIANEIENVKARYAPITTLADAASKLTYSSLMGPQFLAKAMGHPDILANLSEPQRKEALGLIYGAGTGQSGGFGSLNPLALQQMATQQEQSPFARLVGGMRNALGLSHPQAQQQSQQQPEMMPQMPEQIQSMGGAPSSDTSNALNAWMQSPEAQRQAQKEGMITIPQKDQLMDWYGKQGGVVSPPSPKNNTFAENTGSYLGIKKEGEELGKIRAETIKDLDNTFYNSQMKGATLDELTKIVTSPVFERIRQLPALGHHELAYYSRYGTPEEKQTVGQYYTLTGNIVKDSARDFPGQFRRGEQSLLFSMKPSPSDTADAAKGKIEALTVMNQMMGQRAKLTSQLMNQYHIDQATAAEISDKQIDGDSIRNQIHSKLNPKPSQEDIAYTAKQNNISEEEVIKRLKKMGRL